MDQAPLPDLLHNRDLTRPAAGSYAKEAGKQSYHDVRLSGLVASSRTAGIARNSSCRTSNRRAIQKNRHRKAMVGRV